MSKTVFWSTFWLLAGFAGAAAVLAAPKAGPFAGPWVVTKVDVGEPLPGQEAEFSGLTAGTELEAVPEWFGQGDSEFNVDNDWFHSFGSFTFHRVERPDSPVNPPACDQITDNVDLLLSVPINAMMAVGHVDHGDADNHLEDSHLMIFIPCNGGEGKREFRMVVRSFVESQGGGNVTHNGMIHGKGN